MRSVGCLYSLRNSLEIGYFQRGWTLKNSVFVIFELMVLYLMPFLKRSHSVLQIHKYRYTWCNKVVTFVKSCFLGCVFLNALSQSTTWDEFLIQSYRKASEDFGYDPQFACSTFMMFFLYFGHINLQIMIHLNGLQKYHVLRLL